MGSNGPVEKKVTVAGFAAAVTSLVLSIVFKEVPWLAAFADYAEWLLMTVITGVVTYGLAYAAKHTPRNDAGTRKTGTSDNIPPTDL